MDVKTVFRMLKAMIIELIYKEKVLKTGLVVCLPKIKNKLIPTVYCLIELKIALNSSE